MHLHFAITGRGKAVIKSENIRFTLHSFSLYVNPITYVRISNLDLSTLDFSNLDLSTLLFSTKVHYCNLVFSHYYSIFDINYKVPNGNLSQNYKVTYVNSEISSQFLIVITVIIMSKAKIIAISMPESIWDDIDERRGDVNRSLYIRRCIEKQTSEVRKK